jgi:hypothetical protein
VPGFFRFAQEWDEPGQRGYVQDRRIVFERIGPLGDWRIADDGGGELLERQFR